MAAHVHTARAFISSIGQGTLTLENAIFNATFAPTKNSVYWLLALLVGY